MRSLSLFMATSATVVFAASTASAQSVACGQDYIVQPGDFLSSIAKRAYGSAENFGLIYNVNADVIGPNPGLISVGDRLYIPCASDDVVASSANNAAIRRVETTEALPGPAQNRPIRVLTGTDWAPFTDESQEQGGLLTEIINLALAEADGKPEYQIDFINDWGAHLSPLLTDHAYDFSIGWTEPNCELIDQLEDDSKFRCNNFNWSEPLYQEIVGYYTLSGQAEVTDHATLAGTTVCRPAGYSTALLEEVGLSEANITLIRPAGPEECLNAVISGEADVAPIATDVAEGLIAQGGFEGQVMMHEQLSYVSVMQAAIAKTHPRSEELVEVLNSGLRKIKESGVWFQTVRRHMTAHREANL